MLESFYMAFGHERDAVEGYVDPTMLDLSPEGRLRTGGTTLRAGTPLFREAGEKVVASPLGAAGDVVLSDPVFAGVTVLDGQPVDGPLHATAGGDDGVIYVRVKGPVRTNDAVGLADDKTGVQTYASGGPKLAIGNVLEPVPAGQVVLIPVRTNGAGGNTCPF